MNSLKHLQEDFQSYLLYLNDRMNGQVVGNKKASAEVRLRVYADAYRLRLLETLEDNYPALHTLLGDEEFDRLGRAYIDAHPSNYRSIRWFGGEMVSFLRDTSPYSDQPVLTEMAAFEWVLRYAFDATDSGVLTVDDIAVITPDAWPGMRVTLHPSVRRLDLQWNVPAIWQRIDQGKEPEPPQQVEYPIPWVIWRRELRQYFRSLDVDEGWALDAVIQGAPFSEICEGLCEWVDAQHVATHAAGFLKRWTTEGMIADIATGSTKG